MSNSALLWTNTMQAKWYAHQPMSWCLSLPLVLSLPQQWLGLTIWFEPLLSHPLPPAVIEAKIWMVDVEIASEVGWANYKRVADGIMTMLDRTGLLHGYSFNSWSDVVTYDEAFIEEWLESPQTSLYYSLQVMPDTQDKSDVYAALQSDVDEYLADILNEEQTCDCQE